MSSLCRIESLKQSLHHFWNNGHGLIAIGILCALMLVVPGVEAGTSINLGATAFDMEHDAVRGRLYLSLPGQDEIVVVSTATNQVSNHISVGTNPQGIAMSLDGTRLFVALNGSGSVAVVDLFSLIVTETIDVSAALEDLRTYDVLEARPNRLIVTANPSSSGLSRVAMVKLDQGNAVVQVADGRIIRARPTLLADPNQQAAYIGEGFSPNSLYKLDLSSDTAPIILEDAHGSVSGTDRMAISPDGTRIYLGSGQVLDSGDFSQVGQVSAGAPAVREDGSLAYMAVAANQVDVFETGGLTQTGTLAPSCGLSGSIGRARVIGSPAQLLLLGDDTLCRLSTDPAVSGVLLASRLFPFESGRRYVYRSSRRGNRSLTFRKGTTLIEGIATKATQATGGLLEYYSNDEQGIRWHRENDRGDIATFVPPAQLLRAQPAIGETVQSNGILKFKVRGVPGFNLNYTVTSRAEAMETLTVPYGTFETLRVKLTLRFFGNAFGQFFDETQNQTYWLANDLGVVRERDEFDGDVETFDLRSISGFRDSDRDRVFDIFDNCPDDRNRDQLDTDGDGAGDACDADDDGDGTSDDQDAFPLDDAETTDSDDDGIGDNADSDDDNDGVPDNADAFRLDPAESLDTDGDGTGDNADSDDDGDGFDDATDNCPKTANPDQADRDDDATGDDCDAFPDNAAESHDNDADGQGDNADDDDDNDGMLDAFENGHGLDPRDAADAGEDNDDDGYTNLEEAQADTDPNRAADIPAPVLLSPAPGSVLDGHTMLFQWDNRNRGVRAWRLRVGTIPGGGQIYNRGFGRGANQVLVPNLPTFGDKVYVRLSATVGRVTKSSDYIYTADDFPLPQILTPAPGTGLLPGQTAIAWTANGHRILKYTLQLGSTRGAGDLNRFLARRSFNGSQTQTTTRANFSPAGSVYLRLNYILSSARKKFRGHADVQYNVSAEVTPLYGEHGANWNDWVRNSGGPPLALPDRACSGRERGGSNACLHGGELRQFVLPAQPDCDDVGASDALDVFDWQCMDDIAPVRVVSTGFKPGKMLSDLIDFDALAWRANSVTVTTPGGPVVSPATPWWSNPIIENNAGGRLDAEGSVYVVNNPAAVQNYLFNRTRRIALVVRPGQMLTAAPAGTGEALIEAAGSRFLWIEGRLDAAGASFGVLLDRVNFSVLRGINAGGADTGGADARRLRASPPTGVYLSRSASNRLEKILSHGNTLDGVVLNGSSGNWLESIQAVKNGAAGLRLYRSADNRLYDLEVSLNDGDGLVLDRAARNFLNRVLLSGNGVAPASGAGHGLRLFGASQNRLINITSFNNREAGLALAGNSRFNVILATTSSNNAGDGLAIAGPAGSNSVLNLLAGNNGGDGVRLSARSARNVIRDLLASDNGGAGVRLESRASRNRFAGVLNLGNNGAGDCQVETGTGDLAGDCTNTGHSDALLSTGASLADSFAAKVTADDTVNSDDLLGSALFEDITSFDGFETPLRGWGLDGGGLFPDAGNRGPCLPGQICRIWDWRLDGAAVDVKDALAIPAGDDIEVIRLPGSRRLLVHAMELLDDGVGDDDGLCESAEDCLYTPHLGSFQGEGGLDELKGDAIGEGGVLEDIHLFMLR